MGFDASPTQVKDLKQGNVNQLIAQHPLTIGSKAVQIAVDYLKTNKKPSKTDVTTGFTTVTRSNINDPQVSKYLYKAQC